MALIVNQILNDALFCRAYDDLTKKCEENKEKFSEYEKQDVKLREDLKHAKAKSKKLDKNVDQEKKKVFRPPDKRAYWKIIFLFLNQNICCGYSKEPSQ